MSTYPRAFGKSFANMPIAFMRENKGKTGLLESFVSIILFKCTLKSFTDQTGLFT